MRKKAFIFLCLLLPPMGCVPPQPPPDTWGLSGAWVVDLPRSLEINETLMRDLHEQEYMRKVYMIINMAQAELTMGHGHSQNLEPFNFIVIEELENGVIIKLEEGSTVELVREGDLLYYTHIGRHKQLLVFTKSTL